MAGRAGDETRHSGFKGPDSGGAIRLFIRKLVTLATLGIVLSGSAAWSAERASDAVAERPSASLDDVVRGVESRYRAIRTLRLTFTQTYQWGGRTRVESGTAYFARGGMMRWDYREPQSKLVVSDGKRLWLYVPGEKQATRSSMKAHEDERIPFPLLVSHFDLRRIFSKVEFADQALKADSGDHVLEGTPRQGYQDEYERVLMEVTPALDIRRLVVFYPDRSVMDFKFDDVERNPALASGLFTFSPPAGTEIIDQ